MQINCVIGPNTKVNGRFSTLQNRVSRHFMFLCCESLVFMIMSDFKCKWNIFSVNSYSCKMMAFRTKTLEAVPKANEYWLLKGEKQESKDTSVKTKIFILECAYILEWHGRECTNTGCLHAKRLGNIREQFFPHISAEGKAVYSLEISRVHVDTPCPSVHNIFFPSGRQ